MAAKVKFRGGWTCSCVATSLPWVEEAMRRRGIIREMIDIFQLGWRDNVVASKGTHAEGGCTDVGQFSTEAIHCWREWGWTMQRRDLTDIKTHAHGWPYGCTHLAPAADAQAADWDNKDAGLVGSADVVGMWPVKRWDDALEEMVRKMYTLDDIADAVEARRKTFAREVWRGEYVPNVGFAKGSTEGTQVSGSEALISIRGKQNEALGGDNIDDIAKAVEALEAGEEKTLDARLTRLEGKLDAILAALPKPPPA